MTQATYFRCDKRRFQPGETISPARDFVRMSSESGAAVHKLLVQRSTRGINREDYVHVFENIECAISHVIKMTGGILYEVGITSIVHSADMHIVEEIERTTEQSQREKLADEWWSGAARSEPCMEHLAVGVRVIRVVPISAAERRAAWTKAGISPPPDLSYDINDLFSSDAGPKTDC